MFPDTENGDVCRLNLTNNQDPWKIGQHYFLCFPESSIWQSHPFTPFNIAQVQNGLVKHSYIIRAKGGETKNVAQIWANKLVSTAHTGVRTISVILTGPYGVNAMENFEPHSNVVCIAGGTGVSFTLPVMLSLSRSRITMKRKLRFIWIIRRERDIKWIEEELRALQQAPDITTLDISIFITGDARTKIEPSGKDAKGLGSYVKEETIVGSAGVSCGSNRSIYLHRTEKADGNRRPDTAKMIGDFLENTVCGPSVVVASGPGEMISDIRRAVAGFNSPRKVWHGQQRYDVRLICEDRLEL